MNALTTTALLTPATDLLDAGAIDDLIPDRPRPVGRLADASMIETAWPRRADEVARYRDYRRLHRVEAALRGRHALGLTRSDREAARAAEAALAEHQRRVRTASYVPLAANLFRIH